MRSEKKPPKMTDAERHKRFVDMAKEVEVSEDAKAFEKALERLDLRYKAADSAKSHKRN